MKLKLKITNFYSVDLECNKVSRYIPEDDEVVYFQTYFDVINLENNEECECQLVVATPMGLTETTKDYSSNLISDRALLVYKKYNYQNFIGDVEKIVESYNDGSDFVTLARKLERYFYNNYEDQIKWKAVVAVL